MYKYKLLAKIRSLIIYKIVDIPLRCKKLNFVLYVVITFSARGLYLINYIILIAGIINIFIQIVTQIIISYALK